MSARIYAVHQLGAHGKEREVNVQVEYLPAELGYAGRRVRLRITGCGGYNATLDVDLRDLGEAGHEDLAAAIVERYEGSPESQIGGGQ